MSFGINPVYAEAVQRFSWESKETPLPPREFLDLVVSNVCKSIIAASHVWRTLKEIANNKKPEKVISLQEICYITVQNQDKGVGNEGALTLIETATPAQKTILRAILQRLSKEYYNVLNVKNIRELKEMVLLFGIRQTCVPINAPLPFAPKQSTKVKLETSKVETWMDGLECW